jgi:hypothetical protein
MWWPTYASVFKMRDTSRQKSMDDHADVGLL